MISTNGIKGAGLKKWIPIKLLGYFKQEARLVIEREEVLLAIIQSFFTIVCNFEKRSFFILIFSITASIIKSFSDDVVINGNEGQLHQMFTNILSNSEQAITDKSYIKITTKAYDKKVFISIKDSGIGINKAQINRIFEPFYTTKEPGKGTGLGLSIVYNIIKEHKGNIDIKSKQKK